MKVRWQTVPLSTVCQIKPPKSEARRQISGDDLVSFVPMESLGIEQKVLVPTQTRPLSEVAGSYTYFADGDVLLAKITPCFENGKLGIAANLVNGIGFGSSEYIVFRPDASLEKEWLYYFLGRESFRLEGAARMTGAVGHKRVAKEFIEAYPIPVPPLPEQQRIVTLLDEAFDGIATAKANAEKNLQNARAIFESHLDAVLSRSGAGYTATTLGAEVDLLPGYAFPSGGYSDAVDAVRLLRGDNIMQGYFRWEDAKGWPFGDCESYSKFALQEGDVVIAMDRPWVKAGLKRAQICADDLPVLLVQRTSRLRTLGRMRMDFLSHLTGSQSFSGHLLEVQTGIGVPHISGKQIESFKFMLPPMSDQESIASTLNELSLNTQRLEEIYGEKITSLDELKKSLLHRAFNGDL